ncbi:unnamed protein product [Lupinus luteus]|uniref:Uncharacterized protein n=1 Tax=Lupinus luteus TaxID=3873 RepID=A0AAV1WGQ7_LUPLU
MVDGSHLSFIENAAYRKFISSVAHSKDISVRAELGKLSRTEDDLTVEEYDAKLTDANLVAISSTVITRFSTMHDSAKFINIGLVHFRHKNTLVRLARCFGNLYWKCAWKIPDKGPKLGLDLLKLRDEKNYIFKSGLLGTGNAYLDVRKFNANTQVRKAYVDSLITPKNDVVHVMASAKDALKVVVAEKTHLFGPAGRA